NLGGIARSIHKVTGYNDKGGAKPVHGGDRKLKIRGFLGKLRVFREHSKLRIRQLDEKEGLGRERGASHPREDRCEADDEEGERTIHDVDWLPAKYRKAARQQFPSDRFQCAFEMSLVRPPGPRFSIRIFRSAAAATKGPGKVALASRP